MSAGGHVHELRTVVGSRPLILPGTAVIVYDEQPGILLVSRADQPGWGLPGGLMRPGESPEEAGRRELWEETGLVAHEMRALTTLAEPDRFYEHPNGDQVFNVTTVFTSPVATALRTLDPDEVSETRIFPVTRLPADIAEPERPIVDSFLASLS